MRGAEGYIMKWVFWHCPAVGMLSLIAATAANGASTDMYFPTAVGSSSAALPATSAAHPSAVPILNSRPGAAYTLYLDFGGFDFTGTWGNSGSTVGTLDPFDSAPTGGSFNSTEQSYIRNIWARISEKYVGMNVNVTTLDPAIAAGQSATDAQRQAYYDQQARMMHTVVTSTVQSTNSFIAGGGVSFVGVTQYSFSTASYNSGAGRGYHTNFIFTDQLANQGTGKVSSYSLKFIGEAGAHENGHGLKLGHQNQYNGSTFVTEYTTNGGSSAIAPIMGDSYDSARGTWRIGPTSSVDSNQVRTESTQNDVQLLMSNSGMTSFMDDGIAHSRQTATPLSVSAGGVLNTTANAGWILPASSTNPNPIGELNYTTDYFSFVTTGGNAAITINESGQRLATGTADPGGMLDSTFRLLDSLGNVLLTVSNPNSQSSLFNTVLPAGNYYLQIASAGGKNSSGTEVASYYDMGSYFLSGTIAVPEPTAVMLAVGAVALMARRQRQLRV